MSNRTFATRADTARNLPVPVGPVRSAEPGTGRYGLPAALVSQMISARQRLGAQGPALRPGDMARNAYASSVSRTVLRMPAGYRLTQTV